MKISVFWKETPCRPMESYQRFLRNNFLHYAEDENNRPLLKLWYVSATLHDVTLFYTEEVRRRAFRNVKTALTKSYSVRSQQIAAFKTVFAKYLRVVIVLAVVVLVVALVVVMVVVVEVTVVVVIHNSSSNNSGSGCSCSSSSSSTSSSRSISSGYSSSTPISSSSSSVGDGGDSSSGGGGSSSICRHFIRRTRKNNLL